jgi:4-hydroxy-3-methylbut-2-enyl diphosphate reductase
MCKEVNIINTICRPVQNRQDDALDIAENVDLMLVVGSRTSANTMELAALCQHHNANTIHIQNADELSFEDFEWAETIGIASGLSTPEDIVLGVRVKVEDFRGPVRGQRPDPSRFALVGHAAH